MTVTRAVPMGCGHHLPDRVVENAEFAATLDTTDEWIRSRSGIERRHFAAKDEKTSDLAIPAAERALKAAGLEASDLDALVLDDTAPVHLDELLEALLPNLPDNYPEDYADDADAQIDAILRAVAVLDPTQFIAAVHDANATHRTNVLCSLEDHAEMIAAMAR